MKTVDHSYEQALIMHDNVHIHVIMNIIMTPIGSDSGQLETRTVNALFVEMQHMEQYCCEISEGQ